MSTALYIVLERPIPNFDAFVNGKSAAQALERLEAVAKQLGVRPLMEFFSIDPEEAADFLGEHGASDEEVVSGLSPSQWFAAQEGIDTVRGLLDHLRSNRSSVANSEEVIRDLEEFERVLAMAEQEHTKWHLAMDY